MKPKPMDIKTEGIRAALLALYEANDGMLSARDVVEAARDPGNPLHEEFEWDDDTAAEQYRLAQAGMLIRRVKLTIIKMHPKTKKVTAEVTRQFQANPVPPSGKERERGFDTVESMLADPDKRAALLAMVVKEMQSYRRRYAQLSELADVWAAIDAADDSYSRHESEDRPSAPAA
jgi:hypothetical protein